jgi:hypothetical protein
VVVEAFDVTVVVGATPGLEGAGSPQPADRTSAEALPRSSHKDFEMEAEDERRGMTNRAVRAPRGSRLTNRACSRARVAKRHGAANRHHPTEIFASGCKWRHFSQRKCARQAQS